MVSTADIVRKVTPQVEPPDDEPMTGSERLRVMADPTRLAILEALRVQRSLTPAELARLLPHAKGSMRHHLELMRRADFIARNEAGEWSPRSDASIEWGASGNTDDPERAATYQLLDFITTHRRVSRIERWEREKRRGMWDEWVDLEIGRDYAERFTRQDLQEIDEAVGEVMERQRAKAAERRTRSGASGEELIFLTFLGFPFALGDGSE